MLKIYSPARFWIMRLCVACFIAGTSQNPAFAEPKVVAELFTSQGCSSCPPADRLLKRIEAENPDVLAITLPVDYWDYLGWHDTLARPEYGERQKAYAALRGDQAVYTPQMVINGLEHVVGSREQSVLHALKAAPRFTAHVKLAPTDMTIEASIDGTLPLNSKMATVYLLDLSTKETVGIKRGENAGRQVDYTNVVRSLTPIGMWSGGPQVLKIPKKMISKGKNSRCVVIIQVETESSQPGRIIGAQVMDMTH